MGQFMLGSGTDFQGKYLFLEESKKINERRKPKKGEEGKSRKKNMKQTMTSKAHLMELKLS
jgi:hypothetical protein